VAFLLSEPAAFISGVALPVKEPIGEAAYLSTSDDAFRRYPLARRNAHFSA